MHFSIVTDYLHLLVSVTSDSPNNVHICELISSVMNALIPLNALF